MSNEKSNVVFITTPIYYPNDKPHIGHIYTSVLCDVLARYHRSHNKTVIFSTGLDEHGQKIYRTALKANTTAQEYVDHMAPFFKDALEKYNINYDIFIRTTDPQHEISAQTLWRKIRDNGHIVLNKYAGWYNVSDEAFVKADEIATIIEHNVSAVAKDGRPVIWLEEECYFFKLSAFQQTLLEYYQQNPQAIYPKSRLNEVLSFLQQPLLDIAISRTTLDWGILVPDQQNTNQCDVSLSNINNMQNQTDALVPDQQNTESYNMSACNLIDTCSTSSSTCTYSHDSSDNPTSKTCSDVYSTSINNSAIKTHVMYVWIDALANYLTVINYPNMNTEAWSQVTHVIGKDILRFHAIYWPAFLIAADITPPKQIVAHGWWLSDTDEKMSKSLGNAIDPMTLLEYYDNEQIRWFFMREMTVGSDGKFSTERVNIRWNELVNNIGNLMHRSATLINKNYNGNILKVESCQYAIELLEKLDTYIHEYKLEHYAQTILEYASNVNKYFDTEAPWKLNDNAHMVLSNVIYAVKVLALALSPILPRRASQMMSILNINHTELSAYPLLEHLKLCRQAGQINANDVIIFKRI